MALISSLTSEFPGPTLDAAFVAAGLGTVTITAGRVVLTGTTAANSTARIEGVASYDFTNDAMFFQVDWGNQPTGWLFQIHVYGDAAGTNRLTFDVDATAAGVTVDNAGVEVFSNSVAFTPASWTWLRAKHDTAGNVWRLYAATASGGAWTEIISTTAHNWAVTDCYFDLQVQCQAAASPPQTTYVDNFNTGFVAAQDTTRFFNFFLGGRASQSGGGGGEASVTFPRLGGMLISGPQNYENAAYRDQIAKLDVAILGMYNLWTGAGGQTPAQAVAAIKAVNPSILLGEYTIMTEVNSNGADVSTAPIRAKLAAGVGPSGIGDWYLYNAAGAKVVPFSGTWGTNLSLLTTPDGNGDRWPQWKAKWDNTNLITGPNWDIWYSDTNFEDPPVDADWDRDGDNDGTTSAEVKGRFRAGQRAYYDTAKSLQPSKFLMLNTDSDLKGDVYPGGLSIPEYTNVAHGAFLEMLVGQTWSVEERAPGWQGMMNWYHAVFNNLLDPKIVMFHFDLATPTAYQVMRYGLASCLMDNGYFVTSEAGYYHDVLWFDEYDVAGTRNSKWLGAAIDPPQMTAWSNGVYRRRFENGMALANPKGNGSQTVTVGSGYHRIAGTQAPGVNTGAAVTSTVTLADRDGLILVKD